MGATTRLRVILSIQHLIIRGFYFEEAGLVVEVPPDARKLPRCGECGAKCKLVKDRRLRRWRHLDFAGMTVHFEHAIRRAHFAPCSGVKTERVEWAEPGSNFTYAFEERVAFLAQQCSETTVFKLLRTSWRTLGAISGRTVHRKLDSLGDRLNGPRYIGIDELSYRKHCEYVTVVVDHERGVVVWSARGKGADTLRRFFEELGPLRSSAIESVTIDMSPAYIAAVSEAVPPARLILDRFHLQRLVQNALDETRRDEVRAAQGEG